MPTPQNPLPLSDSHDYLHINYGDATTVRALPDTTLYALTGLRMRKHDGDE